MTLEPTEVVGQACIAWYPGFGEGEAGEEFSLG